MKLSDAAQAAARLAVVNDKSRTALEDLLRKWFSTHFAKGISLSLLKAVHQAGAYPAFAQLLTDATDAERSSMLSKLDKHCPSIQMKSKSEILAHIEALASGRSLPADKPKPPPKPKAPKVAKKKVGIISESKY